MSAQPFTLALSKGRLLRGAAALFERAGLPFPDVDGRRLVAEHDGLRFLFVKDVDVPTYVEYGVADCGVAGRDVLLESEADVYEPLELGFGRSRLVVAGRRPASDAAAPAIVRVASKYPRIAAAHFQERGVSVEVVKLQGSVELAPVLGLADCIVDVVETGRTLAENGLEILDEVVACSARLIVNRASYHVRRAELQPLLTRLQGALA